MTNQMKWVLAVVGLAGLGLLALWRSAEAQRPQGSDDQQIRTLFASAARAATERKAGQALRWLSADYSDSNGIKATIARYEVSRLINNAKQIDVYVPVREVEVQVSGNTASAVVPITVTATGENIPPVGTGQRTLNVQLRKEPVRYYWLFPGEEWRVTSVEGYGGMD